MKPVFEWKEPPPAQVGPKKGRRTHNWTMKLVKLATKPGKWALIAKEASNAQAGSMKARYPGFEFVNRSNGTFGYDIYARYIGGEDT